jgi:hypothetical protein
VARVAGPRLGLARGAQLARTVRNVAAKASGSPVEPNSPPRNPSWPPGKALVRHQGPDLPRVLGHQGQRRAAAAGARPV